MELYAVYNYQDRDKPEHHDGPVQVLKYTDTEELAEIWVEKLNADGLCFVNLNHPLKAANYLNSALQAQLPFDNMAPIA